MGGWSQCLYLTHLFYKEINFLSEGDYPSQLFHGQAHC